MHTFIDTVIFDLGGVILNLDIQATFRAFEKLSGKELAANYREHAQADFFKQYEVGGISSDEFRNILRAWLSIDAPDAVLDQAWSAMLGDLPQERVDFLKELGKHKQIFLLSNTNAIHKASFDKILQDSTGMGSLDELFEKAYYSHEMGDRKPNPSIYQTLIDTHRLNPERTLFIDDTAENLTGAQEVGLQTEHLTEEKSILTLGLLS
ncbi:HAD family phosphatase [Rapidithrix thailandica]|uniref:HAD family phosphatase n=1 Tax=Rapidithrix thailandica TaxID=413964 RepID=A0AAW9S0L5_9BACT